MQLPRNFPCLHISLMSLAIVIAVSMLDLWAPNEFRYMRCEHTRTMRATNGNGPKGGAGPHGLHLRAASPVITERGARPQGLTPSIMASQVMDSQASTVPGLSLDVVQPVSAVPQWLQEIQAPCCHWDAPGCPWHWCAAAAGCNPGRWADGIQCFNKPVPGRYTRSIARSPCRSPTWCTSRSYGARTCLGASGGPPHLGAATGLDG